MEVRGIDIPANDEKGLSKRCVDNNGYPLHSKPSLFRKRVTKLYVADWKLGESLLADDADWDAPTWSMRREELPRLQATLATLCQALPEGFEFVASWISEPLPHRVEVSCDELLELCQTSSFNGHTLYAIKPGRAPLANQSLVWREWKKKERPCDQGLLGCRGGI